MISVCELITEIEPSKGFVCFFALGTCLTCPELCRLFLVQRWGDGITTLISSRI